MPETADAEPALHKLVLGAELKFPLCDVPHAPFTLAVQLVLESAKEPVPMALHVAVAEPV